MNFAEYLKFCRNSQGLQPKELAKKINKSQNYILALEREDEKAPTIQTTKKIAEALNIDDEQLIELAIENRFKYWAKKEGFEPSRALMFLEKAKSTRQRLDKEIAKLIKTTNIQKIHILAFSTCMATEHLKAFDILC